MLCSVFLLLKMIQRFRSFYDSLMISLPIGRKTVEFVLPQKEFQILFLLLSYPNRIFSRQQIMNEIKEA